MNYFSFKISLYKLNRRRKKEHKILSKLIEEAEKKSGREAAEEVYQSESFELQMTEDEITYLITRYLISKAEKMLLPTPPTTDKDGLWEPSHYTGKWALTAKGITELNRLIRQERVERLELASKWVTILIGLIGAITGLVAVSR